MSRGRWLLLVAASVLLLLAVVLREPPVRGQGGTLAAVGRSMGGLRVVVIDGLFLRAEALRRGGRVEDAAAHYQAVLDLDPANEAATIFLANLFVDEMLPIAVDADARFLWWREARALLAQAIARRPRSAALHNRAASLIMGLTRMQPDLEPHLVTELGNWRLAALRHLRVAFEESAGLARLGRNHIAHAALLAPEVAARGLRDEDAAAYAEALEIARALARLRAPVLEELLIDPERGDETLAVLLAASSEALEATAAALGAPERRADAEAAIARYDELRPHYWPSRLLRELLERGR